MQAIHSPADDAYALDRARVCLKLYYDPEMDAADRAAMLESYAKALSAYPRWAVAKGFDAWESTGVRRPSPAEIAILASRAVKELTDEVATRKKAEPPAEPERQPVDRDAAAAIMERAGFTPKRLDAIRRAPMASSFAEAEALVAPSKKPHWTETVDYLGPEMAQLRAARMANPLMRAGMDQAERRDKDEAGAA